MNFSASPTSASPSTVGDPRLERVLFVHAHPDDETITTGGTIAALVEMGAAVTVVTCTRGELGEVIPDDLAPLRDDQTALAVHREGEIASAMDDLGVGDHRFLGSSGARTPGLPERAYRDSGMVWRSDGVAGPTPDLHPAAFCAAEFGEVVSDLSAVVQSVRPTAIVSYDEDGGYHHPDHVRANRVAVRAARLVGVPFFAIVAGAESAEGPEAEALAADETVLTMDTRHVAPRKIAALRDHRSQVEVVDLPGGRAGIRFPHGVVEPVTVRESFRFVPDPAADEGGSEMAQLTTGGRVAALVLALAAGAVFGTIGTVMHQSTVTVADSPVWSGLVLALLMCLALLAGLRSVFGSRAMAGAASLGLVGALVVLWQASPGGSVLLPANTPAYVWLVGVAVIVTLVLGWPRLRGLPGRDATPPGDATRASSVGAQPAGDKLDALPDAKGTPQT
ncbi:PIG-L family deacetylase [Frigoribacterium sp. VKM Ac-2836]|uniref:PIG-L family deacetylase n=1 Tax=Frigoribacterium sp. VKM Ac-2836 TaxID=2739014 RepID=UPI001566A46D|nr:PIG-L family deacetylase [Frigoribacterium sp. VKM Ac-2836]NRD27143.1 PIG-L family deacetylase [Frigoribacterium sp. VKM Ac-2836]